VADQGLRYLAELVRQSIRDHARITPEALHVGEPSRLAIEWHGQVQLERLISDRN
jgi:hypothetical protein